MPSLTPRSRLVVAAICLAGIVQQWSDGFLPAWQLALAGYLLALTYEWVRIRGSGVPGKLGDDRRLRLGQSSTLEFRFANPFPYALNLEWSSELPSALGGNTEVKSLTLSEGASGTGACAVLPLEIGEFRPGPLHVRLLGPLGLAWWHRRKPIEPVITVIPDLLATSYGKAGLATSGTAATRQKAGSGLELQHLRPYQPGDPRRTIDWKATARTGALTTRVFGEDQHLEIVLVLDLGRTARTRIGTLPQSSHYINLAARFAERAVMNEDRVGLVAVTDRPVAVVPPGRGAAAVSRIRSALTSVRTEPVETDLMIAATVLKRLVRHRAMIVVLTDPYGASGAGQRLSQCVRLWVPQHLPMIVGLVSPEVSRMAHRAAGHWLDPYTSLAARTYRTDLAAGMAGLERLGAQTIIARPQDLERSVFSRYERLKAARRI